MNETLASYLEVLLRWWQVVAAITLLSIVAAAGYLILKPAEYQSSAVLFVTTPRDDANTYYRGDSYSKERISSYAALGQSPEIAQRVIDDLGLDADPANLVSGTTLTPVPETVLLNLATTGQTPREAQAIAQAYVEELRRSVAALETVPGALTPRAELITVQPPTFESSTAGFPAWMILGGAGGLGLILGGFAAVVISLLDGRVRRPEEAAAATGAPVLAEFTSSVPWEKSSVDPPASESGRVLRTALDRLGVGARVILVASAESGAGKTGIALSVSRALADRGSAVALVDFDSRGSRLASVLDLDNAPTVRTLVGERASIDGLPAANWNGVAIIPFGAREDNPGSTADDPRVRSMFDAVHSRYEWVVVDTPAVVDFSDATRLARHADATLLIAQAGRTEFDTLRAAASELTRAGGHVAGVVFVEVTRSVGTERAVKSNGNRATVGFSDTGRHRTDVLRST